MDEKTAHILEKLGYKAIAYEGDELPRQFKNLVVVKKKVLSTSNKKELLSSLKGVKREKVIVSVRPLSTEVARTAAHDTRVDTIVIDKDTYYFIDKPQINLMKQYHKPLELPFNEYLNYEPHIRSMIYRRIKYYLTYAKQPIIISSRALNWNEVLVPKSIIALLSLLFELDPREALLSITNYPREILVRNGVTI